MVPYGCPRLKAVVADHPQRRHDRTAFANQAHGKCKVGFIVVDARADLPQSSDEIIDLRQIHPDKSHDRQYVFSCCFMQLHYWPFHCWRRRFDLGAADDNYCLDMTDTPVTQLEAEHLFTMTATIGSAPAVVKAGPAGTRVVAEVTGGTFSGPKLSGTILGPAGDWVTSRKNRTIKLDVRLTMQTDDGEHILVTYTGIGVPGADGTTQVRTAPLFETGAEKYAWLNDIQAVGIGVSTGDSVTYDVYALR